MLAAGSGQQAVLGVCAVPTHGKSPGVSVWSGSNACHCSLQMLRQPLRPVPHGQHAQANIAMRPLHVASARSQLIHLCQSLQTCRRRCHLLLLLLLPPWEHLAAAAEPRDAVLHPAAHEVVRNGKGRRHKEA